MHHKRHRTPARAMCLIALLATGPTAYSQSFWDVVPEVSMTVNNHDNVLLRRGDEAGSAVRAAVDAGAQFTNVSQRGRLSFEPRVRADTYTKTDQNIQDSQDYYFRADGRYRWQTMGVAFRTDYSREHILRSELVGALPPEFEPEDPDFEDPEDIDTGRLEFFNEYRKRLRTAGSLDVAVSERNRFTFALERSSVTFSGPSAVLTRRVPFDVTTARMTIRRRVDERNQMSARMFASRYDASDFDNTTDRVGVEAILDRRLSELWRFNLNVGVERADFTFVEIPIEQRVSSADTNVSFQLGFSQRGLRSNTDLRVRRRVNPSSTGYVTVREEVQAHFQYALRPRLGIRFGAVVTDIRTVGRVERSNDREFNRAEVGMVWAMSETLSLFGGVDYATQRFVREETRRTSSHSILLGIGYRGRSRL